MMDGFLTLLVSVTHEEMARALERGTLVVPLNRAAGFGALQATAGLDEATVARVCAAYGPETLAANLLWEVAQAGEGGVLASELRASLGLKSAKVMAGVFSGLGKTLAREIPGREDLFIERIWRRDSSEYHYRMSAVVRAVVARVYS
jgi:hypothetical protein